MRNRRVEPIHPLSRRTVLKSAMAAAAGLSLPPALTSCGYGGSGAGARDKTLRVVSPNIYNFAKLNSLTSLSKEEAKGIGDDAHVLFNMLQNWKKKHPDVELKIEEVDPLTVSRTALLAAKAGNPADVIWVNDLNIPKLAAGGNLTDLGDLPGDWNDYNQQPLTSLASYDGSPVALPFTTDARLTIYDKAAFADAGVTTPPTTWAEFDDALSTLVDAGKGGYGFWAGPFIHTPTMTVLSTLWMLGGDVVDEQGKADLETVEMYKTFEYYNSLINVHTYSPKSLLGVSDQDEYVKMLTDGDVSCQFDGTWVLGQLDNAGLGDQYDVFKTPRPTTDSKDVTLCGFWAAMLPAQERKDDAKTELAFDFAMNFCGPEGQRTYVAETEALPMRPSVLNDKALVEAKSDQWNFVAKYSIDNGRAMPTTEDNALLFDCIQRAFESYLSGSATPQDALSQAQDDFDEGTR
ncbi:extracellular solute-binding protein [Jiangella asiatica]|nr:extracellular solute-binding protein [Jiangella asiatica]